MLPSSRICAVVFVAVWSAQTRIWTGAGAGGLWSDAGNWSDGVPVNGGEVLFGVAGGRNSFDNVTLSLTAFRFAAEILPEHNFHLIRARR